MTIRLFPLAAVLLLGMPMRTRPQPPVPAQAPASAQAPAYQPVSQSSPEKIRIDPGMARGGAVAQVIDSITFTTFESTPNSAFGNIDQLEITPRYYLILDRETLSILIFDKEGQFHAKIDSRKLNPSQPNIYHFCFDRQNQQIILRYPFAEYQLDLDGKIIKRTKASFKDFHGTRADLGGPYTAYYGYSPNQTSTRRDSLAWQLMLFENNHLIHTWFPYRINLDYYDSEGSQSHADFYPTFIPGDSTLTYTREFDYTIYQLTPHQLREKYQFIFPARISLPANFSDTLYEARRKQYLEQNRATIYKICNFYQHGNQLYFKTVTSDAALSYIYNTETNSLLCMDRLVSDASSWYLPVVDTEAGYPDFSFHGILQSDGENMYTSYSSLALFRQMEATRSRHPPPYPPVLTRYFSDKKNSKGNPVLLRLHFKSQWQDL